MVMVVRSGSAIVYVGGCRYALFKISECGWNPGGVAC